AAGRVGAQRRPVPPAAPATIGQAPTRHARRPTPPEMLRHQVTHVCVTKGQRDGATLTCVCGGNLTAVRAVRRPGASSQVAARRGRRARALLVLAIAMLPGPPVCAQQGAENFRSPLTSSLAPLPGPNRGVPKCGEPHIELVPLRGGRTRIAVDTPCRAQ